MAKRWNRWNSSASPGSLGASDTMSPIPLVDEKVDVCVDVVPGPVLADDSPKVQKPEPLVNVDQGLPLADDSPKVQALVPQIHTANGVHDGSHADYGPSVRVVNGSYYSPEAKLTPVPVVHDSDSELEIEIQKIDAACVDVDREAPMVTDLIQHWTHVLEIRNSAGSSTDNRNTADNTDADHPLVDRTRSPYTKQNRIEKRELAHEKPVGQSTFESMGNLTDELGIGLESVGEGEPQKVTEINELYEFPQHMTTPVPPPRPFRDIGHSPKSPPPPRPTGPGVALTSPPPRPSGQGAGGGRTRHQHPSDRHLSNHGPRAKTTGSALTRVIRILR